MREKLTGIFETSIFKWAALFALVFTLSLPVTAKESFAGSIYTVSVAKGYLALRTAKAYDSRNEIGELYTGDTVEVTDTSDNTYWYVYSSKLNKSGYVNRNYLVGGAASTGGSNYTVSVLSGEADIGFMGPETTVYTANEGSKDPVINFAQLTQRAGNFLVAREEMNDFKWSNIRLHRVFDRR